MEINKQEEEASLGEFMKVSLEGFSWAENICQRIENICVENNMFQNPGKYVNVVGEHFSKGIDSVVNNLRNHADDVLELFSELSIGHASMVKASGTKGEELGNRQLHEKHSSRACGETELMENFSLEHHTVPTVNLGQGYRKDTSDETFMTSGKLDRSFCTDDPLSEHGDDSIVHEESGVEIEENVSVEKCACDGPEDHSVKVLNLVQIPSEPQFLNKKDVSTGIIVETPMFLAERLNSAKNFSDAVALDVNLTASISATEANSSMTHQSIQSGGPSPFNSIYVLDIESEETSFLLESDGSELAPNKREKSMKYENLSNFSREEFGNPSIFSLKNEDLGEFEDVKLEDDFKAVRVENDWDDIVKTEIALISSLAAKKQSSKMKLKKLFSSRWRPSRSRELASSQDDWELL